MPEGLAAPAGVSCSQLLVAPRACERLTSVSCRAAKDHSTGEGKSLKALGPGRRWRKLLQEAICIIHNIINIVQYMAQYVSISSKVHSIFYI